MGSRQQSEVLLCDSNGGNDPPKQLDEVQQNSVLYMVIALMCALVVVACLVSLACMYLKKDKKQKKIEAVLESVLEA